MPGLFEIEPFGAGYHAAAGRPHNVRMACALKAVAEYSPIVFSEGEYLPCSCPCVPGSGASYTFGSGLSLDRGRFEENAREHPELADELREIYKELEPFHTALSSERPATGSSRRSLRPEPAGAADGRDTPIRTTTVCFPSARTVSAG